MPRPNTGSIEITIANDGTRTYWLRVTVDGARLRIMLGSDRDGWTEARAEVERERYADQRRLGTWSQPEADVRRDGVPTFKEFAAMALAEWSADWRDATLADARWRLEVHLLPFFGDMTLEEVNVVTTILRFRGEILQRRNELRELIKADTPARDERGHRIKPLSNASINKIFALLARIIDLALLCEEIEGTNAARLVKRLRHKTPRRPALQREHVAALFLAADALDRKRALLRPESLEVARLRDEQSLTYPEICERLGIALSTAHGRYEAVKNAKVVIRLRVVVWLLFGCGLRITEMCELLWSDVNLRDGTIRIRASKTDAGIREVPLLKAAAADLRRYFDQAVARPDMPVVATSGGKRYNRNSANKRLIQPLVARTAELLAAEGRSLPEGTTAHALRKTFISWMHEANAPARWVADVSGHEDPSTGLRIYSESMRDRARDDVMQRFEDFLEIENDNEEAA